MRTRPTSDAAASESATEHHPPSPEFTIRPLLTHSELRACVDLQMRTWGDGFSESVPPTILKVTQRIGGIAAGAFDEEGELLGFVFGMTGLDGDDLIHWSDMLAVRHEARNLGIGRKLKEYQAEELRQRGVSRILWTFDPLVARNAHLNLNKLGAEVVEYVPDMYGETKSTLHQFGTDRFIVSWSIQADRANPQPDLASRAAESPVLNSLLQDDEGIRLDDGRVRIEIPLSIDEVQSASADEARRWRLETRRLFVAALDQGYRVSGFYRASQSGPCYYVLDRSDSPHIEEG